MPGGILDDRQHLPGCYDQLQAFSSDYIANLLEQRERFTPQPGPLHLTRRQDLLDLELAQADLSIYDPPTP